MVEQARPVFSESVRDHIGYLAKEVASQDEGGFLEFVTAKGKFAIAAAQIRLFAPKTDENALLARKLQEDVEIMEEILRQAQTIRQFMGLDPYFNHLVEKGKIDFSPGV